MADLNITPLPVIAPFVVTLPDGTVRKDSLVMSKGDLQRTSQAEFEALAVAKTEDYLAALDSLTDAQAVRDVEELIVQVEQSVDLSSGSWVDQATAEGSPVRYLLDVLVERRDIARPLIEQRTDSVYGDLWRRWLTLLP